MANAELVLTWREHFEDFAQSEMTVRDWCDFNRIPQHQYYYWRRKLLRIDAASSPSTSASWMSVDLLEPSITADASRVLTLRIAPGTPGAEIDIRSGFCPDLLRAVVQALGGPSC
jgi:hypothetical protein